MVKQSVVIPTAGSAEFLTQTLASLLPMLQEDRRTDVVVVENGPQSRTEATVGQFRKAIDRDLARRVRYVHEPVPGLLAGRHRGVFETDGDVISFFDDDVIVSGSHHSALLTAFSDGSVELVGGPARPIFLDIPPDWFMSLAEKSNELQFMMTYMSLIDLRAEIIRDVNPNFIWGQNFHIRRETFFDLRGFHPDIVPSEFAQFQGDGETGLTIKFAESGRRADYVNHVEIRHIIPQYRMTQEFVQNRARYDGVCQAFTTLRNSEPSKLASSSSHGEESQLVRQYFGKMWKNRSNKRSEIGLTIRRARQDGREFLRSQYIRSETVQNWVHRPDFMDFRYPQ